MTNAPTKRQLIESLRSPVCPACANTKKVRQSFCGGCYGALPRRVQRDLYQLIGNGYEDAFAEALTHLGITAPVWPEDDEVVDISDHASPSLVRASERLSGMLDGLGRAASAMRRLADDGVAS